jgi:carbonic anhydrase/acetyltransferase-like protein (isoleucine patch superfamily)
MDVDAVERFAGRIFALGPSQPCLGDDVWVAPGAILIGDVSVGDGSSIWFNCVLRGDVNRISIGRGSNTQDGAIIHVDPEPMSVSIEENVTVGHGCILDGCKIGDRALIGMGATVMNGATIETAGMLAAGAVLTSGKVIRSGELWAGAPAKLARSLREQEFAEMRRNAERYVRNAVQFRGLLRLPDNK